ncbi:MAG: antA/AntB antirepressor family protein [Magnetococcales bacterium]|nr:antA/AntB antirepressor family protein [Magnetococcales bacterium]
MLDQSVATTNPVISLNHDHPDQEGAPTIDARELHTFLDVGRDFSNWVKDRIEKYGFQDGHDYITTRQNRRVANGGFKEVTDYHLTLDMAKELSMVERNAKGREARRYFITCEKELRSWTKNAISQHRYVEMLEETNRHLCQISDLQQFKAVALEKALNPPPRALPVTPELRAQVYELRDQGFSKGHIARTTNRARSTIQGILRNRKQASL